jgi:glycerophosphoryl diester phosphodiesterase
MANNIQWLTSKPIAHRGLHSGNATVPENSLSAFRQALAQQLPIELDIHLLTDGKLAVFHDDDLARMCGANVQIHQLSSGQLKEYRLLKSNEPIPLLDDVFDLVNGRVPLLIEIKNQKNNKEIQKVLIDYLSGYNGDVAVQSFNPFALRELVKRAPQIPRGQLSGNFADEPMNFVLKKLLSSYSLNFISKPHFIAHDANDIRENRSVKKLRSDGMPVLCWTIRSEDTLRKVAGYCDNFIFEGFKPANV